MPPVTGRPIGRAPAPHPVIRRTRSWRGIMQVRFNDTRADRNRILKHAFLWAPVRIFGICFVTTTIIYFTIGHDRFMHTLFGYESEMHYEARVNPDASILIGDTLLDKDRAWKSPLRNLEKPLHPRREFDVLRDPKST
ncbi:hypothetical protein, conserved [Trypanosoma brucei gambiense DAL972]|uniref:Uncharacterized protein n=2 Tax=Trypanosoma brucei TaxID=5691 RepID=C9ZL48_TRYB9|nr:hypothetical protein, conserved [Trypanosoma brucei gambiense DAL972]RHW73772.1 hypothetical protein DPX39_030036300 [Trypanosoma brucei equiperdum]CBH10057.1 hypothetical protein, conserved [Trypanosoma brucei gambiense DAL972]|eukprot:XP_011772347.1 hypothetical protein, conserved [Trypanosoma brucei gambiense DAL972]